MRGIENIHSHFFEKILSEVANARTFLKFVLPVSLQNQLDLTAISFDPTSYISPQYKSSFSDNEKERISFLLIYMIETQDTSITQLEKMLEETKLKGEIAMPTLAQRLREEGALANSQEVLTMLLSSRFRLNEDEKQLIREIDEPDKLAAALKLVVTARTKEEVLESLQTVIL